jgi:glycosyltransferase involved in cell wall biosynthesis
VSAPVRIAYLVSHPIQYQAPMLRRIAQEPGIELTVLFGSDYSVRGYRDKGFQAEVKWDVPLLEGYRYEFLPALRDIGFHAITSPISRGMFKRLRREPRFDLLWVHGYGTVNIVQGMLWAKALGIPVVMRAEPWLQGRPRNGPTLLAKHIYFKAIEWLVDGVLCIGTRNRAYWRHYFGDRVPMFNMPYAVDNDYFQQRALEASLARGELRAELGLEPGRPVILFASKLQNRKRCGDLLEAYTQLVSAPRSGFEGPMPYLVIVGDGEMRADLEAAAQGLEGVRFCGFRNQSELPRFFDLATVFVLPSRHEPWGLIVNEVMNAGRAVIVSDEVGCQPDLITDGVEGLVYPVGDVAALTEALRRIVWTPGLAEKMGMAALERISGWSFEGDVAGLKVALTALTGKPLR